MRQRTLTLPRVLAMMLSGMCTSVQATLNDLFAQPRASAVRTRACSDRAFAKMRRGFYTYIPRTTSLAGTRYPQDRHRASAACPASFNRPPSGRDKSFSV